MCEVLSQIAFVIIVGSVTLFIPYLFIMLAILIWKDFRSN